MLTHIHPSYKEIVSYAYAGLSQDYREFLEQNEGYFPDLSNFLNAFSTLELKKTKYILFGQDPYPRIQSATGYAFIDGAVGDIFSFSGFSREVNRATSLRNFLKMLLVCEGLLDESDLSQRAIADIDKNALIKHLDSLRQNLESSGVVLLNRALIFTDKKSSKAHVAAFEPFVERLLSCLEDQNIVLILFGKMAQEIIERIPSASSYKTIQAPHPYNLSFIADTSVQNLFKPMHLLCD